MTDRQLLFEINNIIEKWAQEIDATNTTTSLIEAYRHHYNTLIKQFLDFREISDHLFDGIYISDGEGNTLYVNDAYSRITGIDKQLVLGRNVQEISDEGKLYKGAVTMKVIESKKRVSSIGKSLLNQREHLVTGSPIFDETGAIRMVVINNRDITELRSLEQEMSDLKSQKIKTDEEIKFLRKQMTTSYIQTVDPDIEAIFEMIETIAPTDVTVLITGESGTGKEVIADEIYQKSNRKDKPFIKINCAAIPGELLESELFGYEKGAFTDANRNGKIGLFELANEGTVLLDEIGDMPTKLQIKLLRVLQNKEIVRLGGTQSIKLNIRLIASTNKDLYKEMLEGRFREDLFYRLNVVPINMKPFRSRKGDIANFANAFILRFNKKYNKNLTFDDDSIRLFQKYDWPGNIRELENVVERLVVTSKDDVIHARVIQNLLHLDASPSISSEHGIKNAVEKFEMEMIQNALLETGSINKASKKLGISQPALSKKCKKYNL